MNCQRGDLALVIGGPAANLGKLVRCLAALPAGFQRDDLPEGVTQSMDASLGPLWRIDAPIEWDKRLPYAHIRIAPDCALMPIRPPVPESTERAQTTLASST